MLRFLLLLLLLGPLALLAAEAVPIAATGDELRERVAAAPDQAIEILRRHGRHEDWRVRAVVAQLLTEHVTDAQARAMFEALSRDADVRVRMAVTDAATAMLGADALPMLDSLARDQDLRLRVAVARACLHLTPLPGEAGDRRVLMLLQRLVGDPTYQVRLATVEALAGFPGETATSLLVQATGDSCEEVVYQAARHLAEREGYHPRAIVDRLGAREKQERVAGCIALGLLDLPAADRALMNALSDREWEVRAAAMEAVGRLAEELKDRRREAYENLAFQVLAGDRDPAVRATAAWTLARLNSVRAIEPLVRLVGAEGGAAINATLNRWLGRDFTTVDEWQHWLQRHGRDHEPQPLEIRDESSYTFYELTDTTTSVAFVIDISGSMNDREWGERDRRMDKLRTELWQTLLQFEDDTLVNAHLFAGQVLTWSEGPRRSTWRNRYALHRHVEEREPGGGTNLYEGLLAAIDQWTVRSVFLLTDGEPTAGPLQDPQQIVDAVVARNEARVREARISAVGIGIPAMEVFLRQLAQRTGGGARMIQ